MPRLAHGLLLLFVAATASAEPSASLAIDDFRPAIDSRGYLTLNGSQVLDAGDVSFGLGSLEWGHHLLSLPSGVGTYSVDDVISATLVGAVGLHPGGVPLELGASLPLTILDGSRGTASLDPAGGGGNAANRLDGQGMGDLGLHAKLGLGHAGRIGLAAIGSVFIPTGSGRAPFLGEAAVTPQLVAVADASFGPLRVAINGGIRLRRTATLVDPLMTGAAAMTDTITTSTDLPVGVAAAWALAPGKLEVVGEAFGAVPVGTHHGYQSLEALGGVKLYLARSSYLSLGAGRGLAPDQAGNPDLRAFVGIVFEPKPEVHRSAHVPETVAVAEPPPPPVDDFPDRDNDGIEDRLDHCPDDPENFNGVEDDDGCPDRDLVVDKHSELVPLRPIEFEFDKAVLRPSAHEILDAVVVALRDNPDIELVEVQGHTDEQGDDAYNLDLSARRAAAVVAYLTAHGIDPARLTSQGYGETRPLDPRHTQDAYRINRRVAFLILRRD